MKRFLTVVLQIVVTLACISAAWGYKVVDVKNGATLKGVVTYRGSVPEDETLKISKDVEYCGKEQKAGTYVVSDSRVKNVVVWIEDISRGKEISEEPVPVTIKKCRIDPHVSIGFVGGEYIFRNDDEILHTIQLKLGLAYQKEVSSRPLEDGASIYNFALPKKGIEIKKPIKHWHHYSDDTGFIQVRSNIHTWIRGIIFIFDHPYGTVTDANGTFVIEDIPPGEYVLNVWHEGFGMKDKRITVGSGVTEEVEVVFEE